MPWLLKLKKHTKPRAEHQQNQFHAEEIRLKMEFINNSHNVMKKFAVIHLKNGLVRIIEASSFECEDNLILYDEKEERKAFLKDDFWVSVEICEFENINILMQHLSALSTINQKEV